MLKSGLTGSPEMILLTNEIISMTRRFTEGVRIDSETLATDVIHEVGPGGEFLSHGHTLSHWRQLWLPHLFDRQRLDKWAGQGSKTTEDRLREMTISLLEEHQVEPLPGDAETESEHILHKP